MAITFDQMRELFTKEGLKFFEDPRSSRILFGMTGMFGRFEIVVSLIDEGKFLQFRTMNYLECPADHPSLPAVLRVLAAVNLQLRLVKFAWDANDGEIVCYGDIWLMDNQITQQQLNRMISNFVPAIDMNSRRLKLTIEHGEDPGEITAADAAESLMGSGGSLPEPLRKLIERLKGGGKDKDKDKDDPDTI